jgi:Holliday junction DNA helicase RuvA
MIAYLAGRVAALTPDSVVVDVGGVGYRVYVPGSVLGGLAEGAPVTVHTHLVVRENELSLFGTADAASLSMFELLLTVNGVGPRLALAMLSTFSAEALATAIASEDLDALTRVSGVGRRTAQRVVLDLKGKLGAWADGPGVPVSALAPADDEAVAALGALGYTAAEARRALAIAAPDPGAGVEARVFAALRHLGGG